MLKIAIRYYGMGKDFRIGVGENCTNGEVRQRVYDGDNRGICKWVFAGNAHANFRAGVVRDMASMRLGNFDFITQATRRNKFERFRKVRNSLKEREK